MNRPRVRLVLAGTRDASGELQRLRDEGLEATQLGIAGIPTLRELEADPPDAIVIDLGRAPSHGRDVGAALRSRAGTRKIPLVFVQGDEEKTARVRDLLPDAVFTAWEGIGEAVRTAIAKAPEHPVVPSSALAGYSGTPLVKKLGLKAGCRIGLLKAPEGFRNLLEPLPPGVRFLVRPRSECDLVIWFVASVKELKKGMDRAASLSGSGGLWIAWPKKASGVATDLTQNEVRRMGLASGLVDYKICAIDATWSALGFAKRART